MQKEDNTTAISTHKARKQYPFKYVLVYGYAIVGKGRNTCGILVLKIELAPARKRTKAMENINAEAVESEEPKPKEKQEAKSIRKILSSKRMKLYNSIKYNVSNASVSISTDKPYTQVDNEGGTIKVFGKHPVKVAQRQFIGQSKELDEKVIKQLETYISNIFNT